MMLCFIAHVMGQELSLLTHNNNNHTASVAVRPQVSETEDRVSASATILRRAEQMSNHDPDVS